MSLRRLAFAGLSLAFQGAAAAAALAAPPVPPNASAPAQRGPAPTEPSRMIVSGAGVTRAVDCAGADVTVTANNSALTLSGCRNIRIAGDHDRISATLMTESEILVLGDHDVVRWTPSPGWSPYVRDQGRGNITAPF